MVEIKSGDKMNLKFIGKGFLVLIAFFSLIIMSGYVQAVDHKDGGKNLKKK